MDSGGGNSKTVSSSEPWSAQKAALIPAYAAAANNYNSGAYSAPAWQTASGMSGVAGFSPEQQQAMAGTQARATNGSPLNQASSDYLTSVLNGNYLGANAPGMQNIMNQITSQVKSQASLNGRYGPNNYTDQAIANGVAQPLFQNYQNERGIQQSAAGMAPNQAAQDYVDLNALNQVGQQRQTQQQNMLNELQQVYNYNTQIPANALNQYLNQIGGNYGQTQATKAPNTNPSMVQQGLGAGVGLLGAYLAGGGSF